jgi:hypothetical protein
MKKKMHCVYSNRFLYNHHVVVFCHKKHGLLMSKRDTQIYKYALRSILCRAIADYSIFSVEYYRINVSTYRASNMKTR